MVMVCIISGNNGTMVKQQYCFVSIMVINKLLPTNCTRFRLVFAGTFSNWSNASRLLQCHALKNVAFLRRIDEHSHYITMGGDDMRFQ